MSARLITSCGIIKSYQNFQKVRKTMLGGKIETTDFLKALSVQQKLNLTFLNVRINNIDYNFLLDSGAPTVISNSLVEKLNLKSEATFMATDIYNQTRETEIYTLPFIEIDNIRYSDIGAIGFDFQGIPILECLKIDGIIGANLMRKSKWKLNLLNQELIISDFELSSLIDTSKPFFAVPFRPFQSGTPLVEAIINDSVKANIFFDTGFNGFLSLPYSLQNKAFDTTTSSIKGFGVQSASAMGVIDTVYYLSMINSLTLGNNFKLMDIPIEVGPDRDILLGKEFMKHYIVVFDWTTNNVYLQPQAEINRSFNSFGFSWDFVDSIIELTYVWENSPASISGLRRGQQIHTINGISVTNIDQNQYCALRLNNDFLTTGQGINDSISISYYKNDSLINRVLHKTDLLLNLK